MPDSQPVYVPTGNPDTVNAANYAPGEVGKTYVSNRKRYQIALLDSAIECVTATPIPSAETKAARDAREARLAEKAKEAKAAKASADLTDVGPVLAGQMAYWKNRITYTVTNAPKAVIEPEPEEEEATAPVVPPPTPQPAPQPGQPAPKPAEPPKPAAPKTPPKPRDLKVAGVFGADGTPGNVCHLQQTGLKKVRVPEGATFPEDSRLGVKAGTLGVATADSRDTIGTTIGPVKDGFVLVDLEIASAD